MKLKLLSVLFALCLLLSVLAVSAAAWSRIDEAADVDGDGAVTQRDATILARFLAGWEGYRDAEGNLAVPSSEYASSFDPASPVDFSGRTFRVLAQSASVGTLANKAELSADGSAAQDLVNAAALERNNYLKQTYNLNLEFTFVKDVAATVQSEALSGSCTYDLVYLPLNAYPSLAASGFLCDLASLSTVDASFFDPAASSLSVNGKTYVGIGAATAAVYRNSYVILADRSSVLSASGVDVLTAVKNGEWTAAKMIELAEAVGTSKTIGSANANGLLLFLGAGGTLTERNGSVPGYPSSLSSSALQAIRSFEAKRATSEGSSVLTGNTAPFTCTHLANCISYTSLSGDYAVLPLPKAASSDPYRTVPLGERAAGFAVLSSSRYLKEARQYGFSSGEEMEGYFLSAFFHASALKGVRDAYRDQILARNYMTAEKNAKADCLDLALQSVSYDFGYYVNADSAVNSLFAVSGTAALDQIPARFSAAVSGTKAAILMERIVELMK